MGSASNKAIGMGAMISFATITAADLQRKRDGGLPSSREWIGLTIAFFMLSAMADFGVPAAGGLAIVATMSIVLARGDDAFKFLNQKTKRIKSKGKQTRKQSAAPHPPRRTTV